MAGDTKKSRPRRALTGGGHTPVMLAEVLEILSPRDGGIYVDGTFGNGGYSRALLESAECRVWAIDRDPEAITRGRVLRERYPGRLSLVQGCFGDMEALVPGEIARRIDGIALDLGVSSMQVDTAERGFSFQKDGPLDMRMEGRGAVEGCPSASELVMTLSESQLADILYRYGEERQARRIARAIVAARQDRTIERTGQLAAIVRAVVRKGATGRIDPATRTFQALRIHVNDELGELERGLEAAERLLAPGGRIVVVSFHSLEDRITKAFLRARSETGGHASRHSPDSLSPCRLAGEGSSATFTLLFRGARKPGDAEIEINPRARSARLRAAVRTAAPADSAEGRP
jgi:16S rRNA (cytosine1402-N4)-methyltransferase